jgi:hypothetical protein
VTHRLLPRLALPLAAALVCLAPAAPAQHARTHVPARTSAQDSLAGAPEARGALSLPGHRWIRRRGASADVYVLAGSAAEHRIAGLSDEAERAIAANLRWLGESSARGCVSFSSARASR